MIFSNMNAFINKKNLTTLIIASFVFWGGYPSSLFADKIILRNGKVYEGIIKRSTSYSYKIELDNGKLLTIPKKNIVRVKIEKRRLTNPEYNLFSLRIGGTLTPTGNFRHRFHSQEEGLVKGVNFESIPETKSIKFSPLSGSGQLVAGMRSSGFRWFKTWFGYKPGYDYAVNATSKSVLDIIEWSTYLELGYTYGTYHFNFDKEAKSPQVRLNTNRLSLGLAYYLRRQYIPLGFFNLSHLFFSASFHVWGNANSKYAVFGEPSMKDFRYTLDNGYSLRLGKKFRTGSQYRLLDITYQIALVYSSDTFSINKFSENSSLLSKSAKLKKSKATLNTFGIETEVVFDF